MMLQRRGWLAELHAMDREISTHAKSSGLRSVAAALVLASVFLAPWLIGAKTIFPGLGWWFGGAMGLSFLLLGASGRWARAGGFGLWAPVVFLLACTGWWALSNAPKFATAFAAEHWIFLRERYPHAFFIWERAELLCFYAGCLCAVVSGAILGRRAGFRRAIRVTLAISAAGVALYALAMRWLGLGGLPWVLIEGGTERFNVSFSHYSGPAACLNLAWPWLLFGGWEKSGGGGRALAVGATLVSGAALMIWDGAAGQVIAGGLLVAGLLWVVSPLRERLSGRLVFAVLAASMMAVLAWQTASVVRMRGQMNDGWVSAEETRLIAEERDAQLRALAAKRGDRLVASPAPDRPSGWLAGVRMARDFPLMGKGPGSWRSESALYTHDAFVNTFYLYRQFVHHDLLQWAAEWGGLAALAMVWLWGGAFWQTLRRQPEKPWADAGLVLALWGVALHSTVDFPLQNPALILWAAVLLGLAWSRGERAI